MPTFPDPPLVADRAAVAAECFRHAFQLPALSVCVAEARRRVVERLRVWGVDEETSDSASLVTSELFTNAVRHTGSERIGCELRIDGTWLRLEVADEGCGSAELRAADGAAASGAAEEGEGEGGRGLLLVDALSQAWGVRFERSGRARHTVWAVLPCDGAPADAR